jgi:hypothetical protein
MLRRVFTLLAGVSLLGVLLVSAIWASHLLPPKLWLTLSTHPVKNVLLEFDRDVIVLVRVQPSGHAVVGPAVSDTEGVNDFVYQFGGLREQQAAFYDTIVEPAFRKNPDQRIEMYGTRTIYIVPYWALLVILGLLPGWRWLPPVARWFEKRFADSPGHCRNCGYNLGGNTGSVCPICGTPVPKRSEAAA